LFHAQSPARIFALSALVTIATLLGVAMGLGPAALLTALILIVVEITFSFENAIINAKILARLSKFWQNMFLTVGILIAIVGMRIIFPILIVVLTTNLSWNEVLDLALHNPQEYSQALHHAHPQIAAFGGAFLLMLALTFFFDDSRETVWFERLERRLQRFGTSWMPTCITALVLCFLALLPINEHPSETILAGGVGIALYNAIQGLIHFFETLQGKKNSSSPSAIRQTGLAAFTSFLYLEMLDASFSLDGVVGAFAVTTDVILIALGLGVGAIWVRSLTVYMVRNGTLATYKYLEHGAHYTVFVLAGVLLFGVFLDVPEVVAGAVGIGIIGCAIVSSRQARHNAPQT
jgi:hypothetical protein